MIYISLVLAVGLGYLIGIMQGGIHVHTGGTGVTKPKKYNKSVGQDKFTDYYDETGGTNKF